MLPSAIGSGRWNTGPTCCIITVALGAIAGATLGDSFSLGVLGSSLVLDGNLRCTKNGSARLGTEDFAMPVFFASR